MTLFSPFNITIRWRFMIAAALPLILITGLLTTYLVQARQQDSRKQFSQLSQLKTVYHGQKAVLELFSVNTERLQQIANSSLGEDQLVGIAYLDTDHKLITKSANFSIPPSMLTSQIDEWHKEHRLYLQQPIYQSNPSVDDYVDDDTEITDVSDSVQQPVGWVIAGFDTTSIDEEQQAIVMTGISLGLGGLVLANLLAFLLGRSIVKPIHQLTNTVQRMEEGDVTARAQQASTEELARLAQGINLLAESVAEGRSNLEGKVSMATKKLEQALQDLRDKNSQLQLARETAEAADHAKSEFLARMSHELRTPITAIQGFTRLLQNTELAGAERDYCTIIIQSSSQLLNLIDDILAISRLQSNAIEIDATPFNLIETLEQSVRQMALPAREKNLELILDIAPEVPTTVVGDHFRVAQIVINLVTNAVKFTNTGHVRTSLNAKPRDDQYTDIRIQVSDTGIGIPKHKRKNLFQAFAQADTSITRKYGGTGLGLAIVKNLVDLMAGTIHLDSTEGVGTTFQVSLPMPITAVEKGPPSIDARVALLDEHPLSRRAVANSLCRFVAELEVLRDPSELAQLKPDAVIYCLPSEVDSSASCEYMQPVEAATDAPLLILTPESEQLGRHYKKTSQRQLRFLDKPATQVSLHSALQQLISGAPEPADITMGNNLLRGLSILIAEDSDFTREFLKTLLSREGAYCVTASNGVEAVTACNRELFDIMLIDIHMPEKSGIETVRDIRSGDRENNTVPIIAITADVLQQEEVAITNAGISDLLFKPVDEELLLSRILQHCRPGTKMPKLHQKLGDEIPVEEFLGEIGRLIELADDACCDDDLEAARDPVHQLLGIAGVFKLPELEVKVANLHRAIKSHRHSQVVTAIDELKQEVSRLAQADIEEQTPE